MTGNQYLGWSWPEVVNSVSNAIQPGYQGRPGLFQKQKRAHHKLRSGVRGTSPAMDHHGGCVQAGSHHRLPCGPVQRQHANSPLGAKACVEELKGGDAIAAISGISVENCKSIPVDRWGTTPSLLFISSCASGNTLPDQDSRLTN